MSDPLRPMPMSPEEIADLVERVRAVSKFTRGYHPPKSGRCRLGRAAYLKRWRAKRAAQA